MSDWALAETNTHQDHVIVHVIGATILGYFVLDETAFLLLDIGFIWNIYLDGEMGLLPASVAISELEVDQKAKLQLQQEMEGVLDDRDLPGSTLFTRLSGTTPVQTIDFFVRENSRRLLVTCERESITIDTSLETHEVTVNVS